MKKVLIFGSGSIGNHMAYACRKLKHEVYITDINSKALNLMKNKIYKKRYGSWDKNINLISYNKIFKLNKKFDLIIIGTPPKSHLKVYLNCKKYLNYSKILIEKPITYYKDSLLKKFTSISKDDLVFCGYNHSISKAFNYFHDKINKKLNNVHMINVSWKEGWRGILNAHFWMKNQFSSYLGNFESGGGALQEHSHGLHIFNLILKNYKIHLKKIKFNSNIFYLYKKNHKYDYYSSIVGNYKKIFFKYETDLISEPAKKEISISSNKIKIDLIFNYKDQFDAVIITKKNKNKLVKLFKKTRSTDFENEIKYLLKFYKKRNYKDSNLNKLNAIEVIEIINKMVKNEK